MRLTDHLHHYVMFGSFALAGLGILAIVERRRLRALLPLGIVLVIVGGQAGLWLMTGATETVVVREHDGELVAQRFDDMGLPRIPWGGRARIVNETDRPLGVVEVVYDTELPLVADDPQVWRIEPRSEETFPHHLEYVGPDQEPPRKIKARGRETRYWLTW